ncbi:hypothetical protein CJ307_35810, partial [Klebsiella quasipneumoniae]
WPTSTAAGIAAIYGTLALLQPEERARVKGVIINKLADIDRGGYCRDLRHAGAAAARGASAGERRDYQ